MDRFHKAAKDGLLDVLKDATRKDANAKDDDSMTPVLWAAFEGKLNALRLLCGRGGDPDKCDQFGNTALHLAAAKGHLHCVDFLIKFGVNMYALDIDKHSAKDLAAINNRDDILRYLDAAAASFESTERKKAKALKELAEKNCEKRVREYMKRQQRLENDYADVKCVASGNKSTKMLSTLKQKIWSSQGNLHKPTKGEYLQSGSDARTGVNSNAIAAASSTSTKFSDLIGNSSAANSANGSLASRSAGSAQRCLKAQAQEKQVVVNEMSVGAFKIGEIEADGKRTITSLTGLQRDSEVLYVGTFSSNEENVVKRGKISDVFEVDNETGSDTEHETMKFGYGTLSRSYSQPDILSDAHSGRTERSSAIGLFDRPMLGSIAFRRSVTAALSQLKQPDAYSMDTDSNVTGTIARNNGKTRHCKQQQQQQRLYLNLSDDSDSDAVNDYSDNDAEDDEDGSDDANSASPIQRFLAVWGLEEYLTVFQKQQIDLETLMLLTEADLKSLGLPLGPFRKLTYAIQERKNALANPGIMQDSRL